MRRSDFKKSGRFGCATCYQACAEDLPPLLKAMHRNDRHIGKVPQTERARIDATRELSKLQKDLQEAIAAEKYEAAAALRDRIQACQHKLEKA